MAKRDSMSTARQSRNRSPKSSLRTGVTDADPNEAGAAVESPLESRSDALVEIVSDERARLMKADAVLGCVVFAMLYDDWLEAPSRPCFADAVAAAQDLVIQAIAKLDSG